MAPSTKRRSRRDRQELRTHRTTLGRLLRIKSLVMFTDPRLREPLTERWNSRMGARVDVPETLPADQRARLHGVRLLADGKIGRASCRERVSTIV